MMHFARAYWTCIPKVPLFRFGSGRVLKSGPHSVEGAKPAQIHACLLHFKCLQDFQPKTRNNLLIRIFDRSYSKELTAYKQKIEQNSAFVLHSEYSTAYSDPGQLVSLGLMETTDEFHAFSKSTKPLAS